jgi:putative transposase
MSYFERRHPSKGVHSRDEQPTVVFLTACTKNRKSWLACDDAHELLRSIWINTRDWEVGPYIIMPDHLHLFASPGLLTRSFDRWITLWKARFTIGFSKQGFGWQQSAFHHRIRTYEDCEAKWKYIRQMPFGRRWLAMSGIGHTKGKYSLPGIGGRRCGVASARG